ncbi:MAG: hypothetical protein CM15mP74_24820 [Halieaceae bacterium]|nr:MAG: hypothetical protein CM15mP74_24820 [Halieaceae bacterium]
MIYIFVSGGSFGIEEMVASSGPGLTLLCCWHSPSFGRSHGTYRQRVGFCHTRRWRFMLDAAGLGPIWGFQAGWWWSLALSSTPSLYIVLSATYLQNQIGFSDGIYYAICWSVIGVCTVVNVLGIKIVAMDRVCLRS